MSSKNKKKAQQTQTTVSANTAPVSKPPSTCAPKHWFGVKIKDDQGNPVTDAKVHLKLNDGTTLDPGVGADGSYKTAAVLDPASACTVSFPFLYDCEWWPDGSSAPAASEAGNAMTTVDGDCTQTLAAKNNYRDYHTIWDQSQNSGLKATRSNPNVLLTGDVLNGPSLKTKTVDKPVDAYATFVVKSRRPANLRIALVDKDLNPLNGWVWNLLTPVAANGTTGADGLIEFDGIDPTKLIGTMNVTIKPPVIPPATPPPAAGPPPSPPPYPPAIKPPDFIDKDPPKAAGADTMEWTLQVGSLPPKTEKYGVKARLHDLGFGIDLASDDTQTGLAIKNFQTIFLKKTATGAYADVQDDLDTRFSQP